MFSKLYDVHCLISKLTKEGLVKCRINILSFVQYALRVFNKRQIKH